ncbi:hypothetical protein [Legionella sp. W05-934-2]|uniref:hypothetical protein n=1 Tax=Legionella sp. W05-934-2 TaxID=1198649 RepID=UPI0034623619
MTIYILSDFDGTITPTEGKQVVSSGFYKTLLKQGGAINYALDQLVDNVGDKFTQEFGEYWPNPDYKGHYGHILIPENAVTVLHQLLSNKDIYFRILTRNRPDYIQALLKYQGFSKEEIAKINIEHGNKSHTAKLERIIPPSKQYASDVNVFALDDSLDDLYAMGYGLKEIGYIPENTKTLIIKKDRITPIGQVVFLNKDQGQFDWEAIRQMITQKATCESILSAMDNLASQLTTDYSPEKQAILNIKSQLIQIQQDNLFPASDHKPQSQAIYHELNNLLLLQAKQLDTHLRWQDALVNLVKSFLALFFGPSKQLNAFNPEDRQRFFYPRESETRQEVTQLMTQFGQALA